MRFEEFPKALVYVLIGGLPFVVLAILASTDTGPWLPLTLVYAGMGLAFLISLPIYRRVHAERMENARYRAVVERAADGILTTDGDGFIETVNAHAAKLFGYGMEELRRYPLTGLLTSDYPGIEGGFWEFLRSHAYQQVAAARDVIGLRMDGSQFLMSLSISHASVEGRTVYVAIVRDVTNERAVHTELREAREELERRVMERTDELHRANMSLETEMRVREAGELEREQLLADLQRAVAEIKTLHGMIPICSSCKKVRDDSGLWNQIEVYISRHSDAEFSHGICPDCLDRLYPESAKRMRGKVN